MADEYNLERTMILIEGEFSNIMRLYQRILADDIVPHSADCRVVNLEEGDKTDGLGGISAALERTSLEFIYEKVLGQKWPGIETDITAGGVAGAINYAHSRQLREARKVGAEEALEALDEFLNFQGAEGSPHDFEKRIRSLMWKERKPLLDLTAELREVLPETFVDRHLGQMVASPEAVLKLTIDAFKEGLFGWRLGRDDWKEVTDRENNPETEGTGDPHD